MDKYDRDMWRSIILVLVGMVLLIGGVLVLIDHFETKQYDEFMAECQADHHTHFECMQMWRVGESHTTVVPMPVVMSH